MKRSRKRIIISVILTFMMICSLVNIPMPEVNAASKSSNMKKLCKRIKAKDDMATTGDYYIFNSVYGYDRTIVYRDSAKKISVVYTPDDGDSFITFSYSASTKKIKITSICSDYEATLYVKVSTYSNKKSQIKVSKIRINYGSDYSKAYAKKQSISDTRLALLATYICIYENTGIKMKDLGFKKFK